MSRTVKCFAKTITEQNQENNISVNAPATRRDPVTHMLFDMDGLLLDTERTYTAVTQKIVGRFGKTFDWSIKRHMLGRPAMDSARYLVQALALPISAATYLAERNGLLREGFAACDALPGAEKLVRHLHRHAIPIAVATSSARDLFAVKITRHAAWFGLFDVVVSGDDPAIARGKPAPDIFVIAAARLGAEPGATLVFEDSPLGLEAGRAAHMRVVAVPDPNMDKACYLGADLIIDSLLEFAPEAYGLPAYKTR